MRACFTNVYIHIKTAPAAHIILQNLKFMFTVNGSTKTLCHPFKLPPFETNESPIVSIKICTFLLNDGTIAKMLDSDTGHMLLTR